STWPPRCRCWPTRPAWRCSPSRTGRTPGPRRPPARTARPPRMPRWRASSASWPRPWTRSTSTRGGPPNPPCASCAACTCAPPRPRPRSGCCGGCSPTPSGWPGWRGRQAPRPRCANRGTCARLRPASFAVLPDRGSPLSLSRHLAAVVLGACVLLAMAGPARAADNSHVLVLGRISDDPKAHYHQLRPLLDYLVPRMADVGIREGRILMAKDEQQMASYLRRGRVDWVTETAAASVLLMD